MKKDPPWEELQKKLEPIGKKMGMNPKAFVCKEHKAIREEVRELRKQMSWRGVARATSNGKCTNQICGWFLCVDAGVDTLE